MQNRPSWYNLLWMLQLRVTRGPYFFSKRRVCYVESIDVVHVVGSCPLWSKWKQVVSFLKQKFMVSMSLYGTNEPTGIIQTRLNIIFLHNKMLKKLEIKLLKYAVAVGACQSANAGRPFPQVEIQTLGLAIVPSYSSCLMKHGVRWRLENKCPSNKMYSWKKGWLLRHAKSRKIGQRYVPATSIHPPIHTYIQPTHATRSIDQSCLLFCSVTSPRRSLSHLLETILDHVKLLVTSSVLRGIRVRLFSFHDT